MFLINIFRFDLKLYNIVFFGDISYLSLRIKILKNVFGCFIFVVNVSYFNLVFICINGINRDVYVCMYVKFYIIYLI